MALDEAISKLIGRIYESVNDPQRWEGVLLDLKSLLNASFVVETVADLRQRELSRSRFYGGGSSRFLEGVRAYEDELYREDPSFHWAARHPHARFCDTAEIMGSEEYMANDFVRYTSSRMGSTHWIIGYTAPEDELTFGVSVHPPSEVGPIPKQDKALFKMLFEHMERAVRLAARPPLFSSTCDALALLDRNGCVRDLSDAAQDLLRLPDGLALRGRQLEAADRSSTARLNAAILSALSALEEGGFGGAVALPRPSGKSDLLVTVTPLVRPVSLFDAFRPAALVRIVDPAAQLPASASHRWTLMFGFSAAEARVAEALMSGDQNLRRAADRVGVSYETARVHLKKLLEKTGTHSQSQLARLLSKVE